MEVLSVVEDRLSVVLFAGAIGRNPCAVWIIDTFVKAHILLHRHAPYGRSPSFFPLYFSDTLLVLFFVRLTPSFAELNLIHPLGSKGFPEKLRRLLDAGAWLVLRNVGPRGPLLPPPSRIQAHREGLQPGTHIDFIWDRWRF